MNKRNRISILLCGLLLLCLSGCVAEVPVDTTPDSKPSVSTTEIPTTKPPETQPPVTEPAETLPPATESSGAIQILEEPGTVARNKKATVTIQGTPNTAYSITVYYKSGPSKAAGLESKTSDASGAVSWTWKVGSKTTPGTYRIVVEGGNEEITLQFTVT